MWLNYTYISFTRIHQVILPCHTYTDVSSLYWRVIGWSEAVRSWRPDLWRVSRHAQSWQVCAILLRERHVSPVGLLLRPLLDRHTLSGQQGVSQTPRQGRRRPSPCNALQVVLICPHLLSLIFLGWSYHPSTPPHTVLIFNLDILPRVCSYF